MEALRRTNPGTVIDLVVNELDRRFERVFICFGGCIEGFENCRPILYLDGTHLKSRFKGCLLSATGKDANDGIVFYLCLLPCFCMLCFH